MNLKTQSKGINPPPSSSCGLMRAILYLPLLFAFASLGAQAQTLSISAPADANEGDSGTRDLSFPVTMSSSVSAPVSIRVCFSGNASVSFSRRDGFGLNGDYKILLGTQLQTASTCIDSNILAGQTSQENIGIRVKGDLNVENDEIVTAALFIVSAPNGVTLSSTASTASHTILDDDTPPPVPLGPLSIIDFILPTKWSHDHFSIGRQIVTDQGIMPSSNDWGYQLCFTGDATYGEDYTIGNNVLQAIQIDNDGCTKTNDREQGTGRRAGFDRVHFYVNYLPDSETEEIEGDESIIVTLRNPMGTNLYGDNGVSYRNSLTFIIKGEFQSANKKIIPNDWPLKPSGIGIGEKFRLMFMTSTRQNAKSSNINDYNTIVQNDAAVGHSSIRQFSSEFRVLASTSAISARTNTETIERGFPIYWLNGDKVADDYNDFYDGSWSNADSPSWESGIRAISSYGVWTGSNNDGSRGDHPLGGGQAAISASAGVGSTTSTLNYYPDLATEEYSFYALSPVFEVAASQDQSFQSEDVQDSFSSQDSDVQQLVDYSELKAQVRTWAGQTQHGQAHVARWMRVLAAFGEQDAIQQGYTAMTAAEARNMADTYTASRWNPIVEALIDLESRATAESQSETEPEPEPEPVACVSQELEDDVEDYSEETHYGEAHVERWLRVLHTFLGTANDATVMTAAGAREMANTYSPGRWNPVVAAIQCLEEQALQQAMSN